MYRPMKMLTLLAAMAVIAHVPVLEANIINNPGFDSGMTLIPNITFNTGLDGWSLSNNSAWDNITFAGDPNHLATVNAGLYKYGGQFLTSDVFDVSRTGNFQISYDVFANAGDYIWYQAGGGQPGIKVTWYDADDNVISSPGWNPRWTHGGGWEHHDLIRGPSGSSGADAIPDGAVKGQMRIVQYGSNPANHHIDNVWMRTTDWDPDYLRKIGKSADALSGEYVLNLSSTTYGSYNNGATTSLLQVKPNTTYSVDYNYKYVTDPNADSRMILEVWFYDADGNQVGSHSRLINTSGVGTDWQLFPTQTYTTPAGAAFAKVRVANRSYKTNGPDTIFDNVVMNSAPVALFTATYNMDTLMIDLDASASYDNDWRWDDGSSYQFRSDTLTYDWLINGTTWLSGMQTSVRLDMGEHDIQLFVSDAADNYGRGFTSSAQTTAYSSVPEPATMGLLLMAGAGLARYVRRRRVSA